MNGGPTTRELEERINLLADRIATLEAALDPFSQRGEAMSNTERNRLIDEAPKGAVPGAGEPFPDRADGRRDILGAPHREQ